VLALEHHGITVLPDIPTPEEKEHGDVAAMHTAVEAHIP
jgi:hypothetical protein